MSQLPQTVLAEIWYAACYPISRENKAPRSFPCDCAGARNLLASAATFAPLQALIPSFVNFAQIHVAGRHGKDRAKARSFYKMGPAFAPRASAAQHGPSILVVSQSAPADSGAGRACRC